MARYQIVEKQSGQKTEIDAVSEKQALYKLALEKTKASTKQEHKRAAGILYGAMLKSHEAMIINDSNQQELFN